MVVDSKAHIETDGPLPGDTCQLCWHDDAERDLDLERCTLTGPTGIGGMTFRLCGRHRRLLIYCLEVGTSWHEGEGDEEEEA